MSSLGHYFGSPLTEAQREERRLSSMDPVSRAETRIMRMLEGITDRLARLEDAARKPALDEVQSGAVWRIALELERPFPYSLLVTEPRHSEVLADLRGLLRLVRELAGKEGA